MDFWKVVSYRIRICKSPKENTSNEQVLFLKIYLYRIDGSKSQTAFGAFSLNTNKQPCFNTIYPQDITSDIWRIFVGRIEKIMSTMVLSIYILKREVDELSAKLKKYDLGKIDVALLLGFEENNVVTTIEIISELYLNREKYDKEKTLNQNLQAILNLNGDTLTRTQEDKVAFVKLLVEMDKDNKLSEYIWNGINTFNEIYENEISLTK